jgi:NIMA (never in mitosis gene a)-related kinase
MEFCEKGDLASELKQYNLKRKNMPEERVWEVVKCVCKGLRDLHNLKVFHRDIKCANLFVDNNSLVKIGDLNVSKLQKSGLAKTQTGTPYYCPPEIWADKAYDNKCDIWSMGIVLYELCAGKPPFDGANMQLLYKNIASGKYKAIPSTYSKEMSNLITKMLKKNPNERPNAQNILDN